TQTIGLTSTPTDLSDHYLLVATLECPELVSKKSSSPIKKKYFDIDNMDQETWSNFANKTDTLLGVSPIKNLDLSNLTCKSNINFFWTQLQNIIIKAADFTIPVKQSSTHSKAIRPKILKHAYSTLKSLQKWLKITNEILKTQTFSIEWNKFFVKIPPTIQEMQISLLEHDDPLTK
ncbi:11665_t:CDS:1, partial [Funneliformis geosporum]